MSIQLTELIESYRGNKAKYRFFDLNCWSASTGEGQLTPLTGLEVLIRELGSHHIHDVLITNPQCLDYNAGVGNEQLIEQISGSASVYGAIIWAPELAASRQHIAGYLDRMIAHNIAAVRMFPKKLNYSLQKWQVGDVLLEMEARRLPLILWHMEASWETVHDICTQYPKLPVIIEGNDQKLLYHNRYFIRLLEMCPNLYIETHNLIQHGGVEYLVNDRAIDRLIFGSYFPYNDPNSAMMMITEADIPEEAKFNIAGGHLRRLIGQIHPKP
ncbi:hypothetical protein [Paenibacillus eucommiae]|uniref:Amidohydrolase-related domain-containing protein n=1 Tax=Paenibacillus eucommiae TaxID=1355755 RepID=A0ABS4J329_9BACL|nr:hypothetical protein [Paenibacillus eucommiae]MBP1993685.1 hypothetical protein [Paenibacillus eucommiae]